MKKWGLALAFVLVLLAALALRCGPPKTIPETSIPAQGTESAAAPDGGSQSSGPRETQEHPAPQPETDPALAERIQKLEATLPKKNEQTFHEAGEVHQTPEVLMEAGRALGELAEELEKSPGRFKQASEFYARCANESTYYPAVRAICLHSLLERKEEWAPGVEARLSAIPAEIYELARDL